MALLTCAFLGVLDGSIIGTALPSIVREVGGDDTWYLWLVTAYLITSTVSVPVYGRCADLFGRKRLLLSGLGLFLAGSVACGAAGDLATLIAARTVQGLGAGALLALAMAVLRDRTDLGSIQTAMGVMLIGGLVGGPIAGGLITDHLGWRWAFWLNLPIGLAAGTVIAARLPADHVRRAGRRLDLAGIALLTGGLTLVLLVLSLQRYWLLLAPAALLLLALVPVERRAELPILPPGLLGRRDTAALLSAGFWFQAAALPVGVFLPLYLQNTRHFPAATAALVLLPMLGGMAVANRVTAAAVTALGRTKPALLAGAALITAGSAAFAALPTDSAPVLLGIAAAAVGFGLGPAMGGLTIATLQAVPRADTGLASAASILTKQLGGSVGLAAAQLVALPALRIAGWAGLAAGTLAWLSIAGFREAAQPLRAADPAATR
ncbi:MFS transporter [Dactylosporangium sucinum]|uniref:MFS transporter n=1 Tax=Dactylosporangium sucinum TaxID=1424081 RepID=A0A917UFR8_9ACTN|nr:MFS transporter [Dactylosporangium sucinum]